MLDRIDALLFAAPVYYVVLVRLTAIGRSRSMKRIAILGSTGSIGQSALAVVDAHPDRLQVVGLAAGENAERLARADRALPAARRGDGVRRRRVDRLEAAASRLAGVDRSRGAGRDGLVAVASHPDVDLVLCASSGTDGLEAVLAAIEHGKTIALANKEVLVMAGGIVTEAARRRGVAILPVDSEHNAIHQCLHGRDAVRAEAARADRVGRTVPRTHGAELSRRVGATDALKHPTWRMGRKITIDSATLMNKGLEVIEAHWLFGVARRSDRRRRSTRSRSSIRWSSCRRLDHRAARRHRHAAADSVRVLVSRALAGAAAVARSRAGRAASSSRRPTPRRFRACGSRIARSRRSAACRSC